MATGRVPTTANSPLTAKGDLFTYSTAPARLAVGNNGDSIVADSSTSTGLRYTALFGANKNAILNGDFRINQRAFTSITADATYGFDRWALGTAGGATYTPQTFTAGAAPVAGYEAINFAQVATTGQSATNTITILLQKIEDVRTFAAQTATISFWAKATSGTPKIAVEMQQNFGSGGSANVNTYAGQITMTASWARYSVTVAVPSVSGKTIGTSSFLGLQLWTSAGSDFNVRTGSLGIQTATIGIWGVQVEAGSVATAFQTATGTIQGELAACQRYYFRWNAPTNPGMLATTGLGYSTTALLGYVNFPVTMRSTPSALDTSAMSTFAYDRGNTGSGNTPSSITADTTWNANIGAYQINTTGITANSIYRIYSNAASAFVGFTAEL